VENSIWHGILPMEGQGHVSISASPTFETGRVVVRIEDDGIGMEESQRTKSGAENDHISRGIEITKGRADVLRRLELTDIRIDGPKDRENGSGERQKGTVVTIELPVNQGVKNRAAGLEPAHGDPTFEA
jgi:LytS/YehU family sensor histidine kinase